MKTLVIANPISGPRRSVRYLPGVVEVFSRAGWHVDALRTRGEGHARRAAAEFQGDMIVSFGGDGTFNEVLNGADLSRCTLAVIPAGTGNVLAKELSVPRHPLKAARAIVNGHVLRYDVGKANGRRFAFGCGAGLDAHVIRLLHRDRDGHITQLHYMPYLLRHALTPPEWNIRVMIDNRIFARNVNVLCIGNTKSYGGPIELTPRADPQDGWLDVTAARLGSTLNLSLFAFAALTRGLAVCNHAHCTQARRVQVSAPQEEVPYHIDGDFAGTLPLSITMEAEPMRIIRPASPHARNKILPV